MNPTPEINLADIFKKCLNEGTYTKLSIDTAIGSDFSFCIEIEPKKPVMALIIYEWSKTSHIFFGDIRQHFAHEVGVELWRQFIKKLTPIKVDPSEYEQFLIDKFNLKTPEHNPDVKTTLTTTDFINLGLDHISEIDDSLNNEKTYNKVISRDEVYTFVHHSDTSELCISVHGIRNAQIVNYERLFKGIISNPEALKNIIEYLNKSTKIKP
jgi:hypothetical protein